MLSKGKHETRRTYQLNTQLKKKETLKGKECRKRRGGIHNFSDCGTAVKHRYHAYSWKSD